MFYSVVCSTLAESAILPNTVFYSVVCSTLAESDILPNTVFYSVVCSTLAESDRMQPSAKQRSSNEQIKKYIAKQRSDRIRRQREEKRAQQLASEKRKEQLDELRRRSSTAVQRQAPPRRPARPRGPLDEPGRKSTDLAETKDDHVKTAVCNVLIYCGRSAKKIIIVLKYIFCLFNDPLNMLGQSMDHVLSEKVFLMLVQK